MAAGRDPLALVMAALTGFVALIVTGFAARYMRADAARNRFGRDLGLVVGCVLATVTTGNLAVLALGWIGSGQALARLIGHDRDWAQARAAARLTRLTIALGDAALVMALAALAWFAHSLRIEAVLRAVPALPPLLATALALLLVVAAAVRCALPPFSGWLAGSMTAPTPVSALMHAGLVNGGGFLLIRLAPLVEASPTARLAALALGLAGALIGLGVMLVRPDIKRSLAGSTTSQMGFMILSCALGAYGAALWHIVAHGLFKAWLLLGSGSSIGITRPAAEPTLPRAIVLVAPATLMVTVIGLLTGRIDPADLPLLLAVATAVALAIAITTRPIEARARLIALMGLGALIAGQVLGLALMRLALGADHAAPLPQGVIVLLPLVFLAGWGWQARRAAPGPRLYVHLLNAGTLPHFATGDAA
jgi:NADH:ubiquinone oxidoreductase subunit 5 (subunit L)/multisubunit Na+/H+ antiporter MnhA subunit